jgi:hypothetical protein
MAEFYHRSIVDPGKQSQFLVLASFLLTFLCVRVLAYCIRDGRLGTARNVVVRGIHIHHFVWGISLLLVSGYLTVALASPPRTAVALLFGCGAALTLDEFALWLHLEDVYWTERGRRSIDAVVLATTALALLLVNVHIWAVLMRQTVQVASLLL